MVLSDEMKKLRKPRGWTQVEDDHLRSLMLSIGGSEEALGHPDDSTEPLPERSIKECITRWRRIKGRDLNVTRHSGSWTAEEDRILKELVAELGPRDWTKIQKRMNSTRDGKQCRERWHNHLNPHINKKPFTAEEDRLIAEFYQKFGSKWAEMARRLPGRTDNAIKNHFNTSVQRRQRQKSRGSIDTGSAGTTSSNSPPVSPRLLASSSLAPSSRFSPYQSQGRRRAGSAVQAPTASVFTHSPLRDRRPHISLNTAATEWVRVGDHYGAFGNGGPAAGCPSNGPMTAPAETSSFTDYGWGATKTPPPDAGSAFRSDSSLSASLPGQGPYHVGRATELASVPLAHSYSSPGEMVQSHSSHSSTSSSLSTPPQLSGLSAGSGSYGAPDPTIAVDQSGDVLAARTSLPTASTSARPPPLQRTYSMPCYNPFGVELTDPFKSSFRDDYVAHDVFSTAGSEDSLSQLSSYGPTNSNGWSPYSLDVPTYSWEGFSSQEDQSDSAMGDVTLTDQNYGDVFPQQQLQQSAMGTQYTSLQALSDALPSPPPLRHPQPQSQTQILNLDAFSPEAQHVQLPGSLNMSMPLSSAKGNQLVFPTSAKLSRTYSHLEYDPGTVGPCGESPTTSSSAISPFALSRSQSFSSLGSAGKAPPSSTTPTASSQQRQRASVSRDTMTDAAAQLRQNTSHYYA